MVYCHLLGRAGVYISMFCKGFNLLVLNKILLRLYIVLCFFVCFGLKDGFFSIHAFPSVCV